MKKIEEIVPIIIAGGAGTRLWPLSRDSMPKQFIPLFDGDLSTFQATLRRVRAAGFAAPIVITNADFRFVCAEQVAALGMTAEIVLEPERRDSAAAIAVGALMGAARGANALCLVLAADHAILDEDGFRAAIARTAPFAAEGRIMTLGITPSYPATAYGYIKPGARLGEGVSAIERFVEKPDRPTAERYLAEGYLWNSGNFAFAADVMRAEIAARAPAVLAAAEASLARAARDADFIRLDREAFAAAPRISIDYAVMEKTGRGGVVAADFGWSDVGSWDALHALKRQDRDGNVLEGKVEILRTTNSLVRSDGILTTVVGLDDVVVVTTGDAVLVAAKQSAPDLKALIARLKAGAYPEAD